MRCARIAAVSSALLFSLVILAPHHLGSVPCLATVGVQGSSPQALIVEFYPRGLCADEYMSLFNAGDTMLNLRNWSLTDGEGTITILRDLWAAPRATVSMSFNSTSFSKAFGRPPSMALGDAADSGALINGTFRLGDQGDSISLISPVGLVVDSACYGTDPEIPRMWYGSPIPDPKQGEVLKRVKSLTGFRDSDSSSDWSPFREFRYGYTEMPRFETEVGPGDMTAFTSPDSSLSVLLDCVRRAQVSVRLCAYEASSAALRDPILEALARGVTVQLLVDGAPVGGMSEEEVEFLSVLAKHGADVRVLVGNSSQDIIQHVYHLHAKYAIFDGREAVVLSENFVESALPLDQLRGNRGWGVLIENESLAAFLALLFESDSRTTRPDVRSWLRDQRFDETAAASGSAEPLQPVRVTEPMRSQQSATVSVRISPDCSESSPFMCEYIAGSSSLLGEQFQCDLEWSSRWTNTTFKNPLLTAIAASVRNGSRASMLFDSTWFNYERNAASCEYLLAESAGANDGFRMMAIDGPIELLHNKGLVMNDRLSVISSNNWVSASFSRNRELALVIDSPEIASFFTGVFRLDWQGDESPPVADAGEDVVVRMGERVVLDGSMSRDDHVVATWSWHAYSDGHVVGSSPRLEFFAVEPGKHEAVLTVEDPWGNSDTDTVVFTVLPSNMTSTGPGTAVWLGLSVAAGASGIAVGVLVARKINHRIPD